MPHSAATSTRVQRSGAAIGEQREFARGRSRARSRPTRIARLMLALTMRMMPSAACSTESPSGARDLLSIARARPRASTGRRPSSSATGSSRRSTILASVTWARAAAAVGAGPGSAPALRGPTLSTPPRRSRRCCRRPRRSRGCRSSASAPGSRRPCRLEAEQRLAAADQRHVGARAAHVEGDQVREARRRARSPRRPRRRPPGPTGRCAPGTPHRARSTSAPPLDWMVYGSPRCRAPRRRVEEALEIALHRAGPT